MDQTHCRCASASHTTSSGDASNDTKVKVPRHLDALGIACKSQCTNVLAFVRLDSVQIVNALERHAKINALDQSNSVLAM